MDGKYSRTKFKLRPPFEGNGKFSYLLVGKGATLRYPQGDKDKCEAVSFRTPSGAKERAPPEG